MPNEQFPRRHVPAAETASYADIAFGSALARALEPCGDYDVNRWLFVPNTYCDWRYLLGTRGSRPLICVGINPSTARPDALDPTLRSVQRIALGNGYDSFIMYNVYPQRATSPGDMEKRFNPAIHAENLKAFRYALSLSPRPAVWAAWGNIIEARPFLKDCARDLLPIAAEYGAAWLRCGPVSRKGHPHHPLYLRADEPLAPYDPTGSIG